MFARLGHEFYEVITTSKFFWIFRGSRRSLILLRTMSLYVKDLKIWSLSLACALNNDSVPQTCCVELYTDTLLLRLFLIHQCFHVWCWKCFGIHVGDILKKWEMTLRLQKIEAYTVCTAFGSWMWMSPSFFVETCMYGNGESLRLSRIPAMGEAWNTWNRNMQVSQALATPQYKNRVDTTTNDQFTCSMHCQRHTPCSHKAISWQVLGV